MTSDEHLIGGLEGKMEMVIRMLESQTAKSDKSRSDVHNDLRALRTDVQDVKNDIANLRSRIEAVEPAAEKVREWSTSKAVIVTVFTILVSGVGAIGAAIAGIVQYARHTIGQ